MADVYAVSDRFPYLRILVTVRGHTQEVEALVDTGFTGFLVLPQGSLGNGRPPDTYYTWTVADGREVTAPIYRGTIQLGSAPAINALITVLGDEPIIGLRLTNQYLLTLDHGTRITVAP